MGPVKNPVLEWSAREAVQVFLICAPFRERVHRGRRLSSRQPFPTLFDQLFDIKLRVVQSFVSGDGILLSEMLGGWLLECCHGGSLEFSPWSWFWCQTGRILGLDPPGARTKAGASCRGCTKEQHDESNLAQG
uniref:Uncharacterized protein n=1 Tax=Pyrodinium bahamense TaxID=73915 RepID=A0A7S0A253_9DINO